MAKTIEQIINDVIKTEGGYVNHPSDRGGPTRYGITQAVARENGYLGHMSVFPLAMAFDIYQKKYVTQPRFDHIHAISPMIGEEMIDTGINMGVSVPTPWLQRLLNAMGAASPDLRIDGVLGPKTYGALETYLKRRGSRGERILLGALNALQAERYLTLTEARAKNRDFFYGWLNNRVGF